MGKGLSRRAALACLGSGVAAMVFGSAGFESTSANRNVGVNVSGDITNALLGVSTNDGTTVDTAGSTTIGQLTNNFDETLSQVSLEIVEIQGTSNDVLQVDPISQIDDTASLSVNCNEEVDAGSSVVTFRLNTNGPSVSVSDVTFDATLDIQCQPVVFGINGSVLQKGNSGKVYFNIQTDGDVEAEITGYSITTKNDLDDIPYDDQSTTFGGSSPPVTFNDQIEVELKRFDAPNGRGKIQIEDTDFVDADSSVADIVVTLEFRNYDPVSLAIDATYG